MYIMKNRYYTKFCGITNVDDALNAQNLGCNAIGFVFVKKSKRYIDAKTTKNIINRINPSILTVALFADNSADEIAEILDKCSFHVLQFHGSETVEFCSQWNRPYWKAIPMADNINPIEYAKQYSNANGYLIDNYGDAKSGGGGNIFDWKKIPQGTDNKWILAGGLTPENIHKAVNETNIKNFDVSSGIEKYPGIKSKHKMKQFLKNLNTT